MHDASKDEKGVVKEEKRKGRPLITGKKRSLLLVGYNVTLTML